MGKEIEVNTLEDMCDLMCNNVIPASNHYWIFTFGCGRDVYGDNAGKAVKVYASSYGEAREKMCEKYGTKWAFQYSAKDWNKIKNDPKRFWEMEEVMEVIE